MSKSSLRVSRRSLLQRDERVGQIGTRKSASHWNLSKSIREAKGVCRELSRKLVQERRSGLAAAHIRQSSTARNETAAGKRAGHQSVYIGLASLTSSLGSYATPRYQHFSAPG